MCTDIGDCWKQANFVYHETKSQMISKIGKGSQTFMHGFSNQSKISDRILLVINWHRTFAGISHVLHESYQHIAEKYSRFKTVLPQPPIVRKIM